MFEMKRDTGSIIPHENNERGVSGDRFLWKRHRRQTPVFNNLRIRNLIDYSLCEYES